jgi:hypothetical protein
MNEGDRQMRCKECRQPYDEPLRGEPNFQTGLCGNCHTLAALRQENKLLQDEADYYLKELRAIQAEHDLQFYKVLYEQRKEKDKPLQDEADYYLKELNEIWDLCMPSRQGHFQRNLGSLVLNKVADAVAYRQRQMILAPSAPATKPYCVAI